MISIRKPGGVRAYAYDGERRLVRCGDSTYAYDYTGRRIVKRAAGATTFFVTPHYEVTVLPDGRRQRTKSIAGAFGVVATVTDRDGGGAAAAGVPAPGTFYFHRNQVDSTTHHTDAAGRVAGRIAYLPYGEIHRVEGSDAFRMKFTGKELDAESGLYYFESRYYDPFLGRFTTSDDRPGAPLGREDALNRYAYVLNNPISHNDPSGHGFFSDLGSPFADTARILAHDAKGFANQVADTFTRRPVALATSFVADAALTIAGIAILATSPFGGPASIMAGNTLLGAGIGGFTYSIRSAVTGSSFQWGGWGTQVGIGGAAGLVVGGFGAMGSATGTTLGTVLFETFGGAAGGVFGQFLQNAAAHTSLETSLVTAAIYGGATAYLGSGSGAIVKRMRSTAVPLEERVEARLFGQELPEFEYQNTWTSSILVRTPRVAFKGASFVAQRYWYPDW
jgi:RHS repeat-associated protein